MMRGVVNLPPDERVIAAALEGLTCVNQEWLRRFPGTPSIFDSGVRYVWEPPGQNWWSIPECLYTRRGDCKDFSAWWAAELRERYGVPPQQAYPYVYRTGPRMFHAVTMTPWGLQDPSKALGMRGPALPYLYQPR